MILIDANLLLYAYNSSSEHHRIAREWLDDSQQATTVDQIWTREVAAAATLDSRECDGPGTGTAYPQGHPTGASHHVRGPRTVRLGARLTW